MCFWISASHTAGVSPMFMMQLMFSQTVSLREALTRISSGFAFLLVSSSIFSLICCWISSIFSSVISMLFADSSISFRYSRGVFPNFFRKWRLSTEGVEKPLFSAISVTESSVWHRSSAAFRMRTSLR